MHNINDVHSFNVIQILTGGNRNYISAPERRNITGNEGQYIRPKWASMSNVAKTYSTFVLLYENPVPIHKIKEGFENKSP